MPYDRTEDLPQGVKNALPSREALDIWRRVFNESAKRYKDETKAFQVAWTAVKNAGYVKNEKTGKWHKQEQKASDSNALEGAQDYKTEDGKRYPKEAFAYTPTDKPSTWKLRLWESPEKKVTARQVGMAVAAPFKSFRGRKVRIPSADRAGVLAKVRRAWKEANPDRPRDEMPKGLRADAEDSWEGSFADLSDIDAMHDFGTLQLTLSKEQASAVRHMAARIISPDDVHPEKGLETCPHITVRYGLTGDAEAAKAVVNGYGAIDVVVQGIDVFSVDDGDYDVVVLRVDSPRLYRLRELAEQYLDAVPTYPKYRPHITLGYVLPAAGEAYRGVETGLEGEVLHFTEIDYNAPDDTSTTIRLEASIGLEALAMTMPAESDGPHPNKVQFKGVLTRVDEPSDRAPHGSRGHRVIIPAATAEKAIPSLLGMGVDVVAQGMNGHNSRHKVGIITAAWLDGRNLKVEGFLYGKDFAAEVESIREESKRGLLGMSYELTDALVEDPAAPVWVLRGLTFTGAAILERKAAAYGKTALIAACAAHPNPQEVLEMVDTQLEELQAMKKELEAKLAEGGKADMQAMGRDMVMNAMRYMHKGGKEKAYEMMGKLCGMDHEGFMKAMGEYAKMGDQKAEGDDKAAAGDQKAADGNESATSDVSAELEEIKQQLASLKAQNELLTDINTLQKKLLTDRTADAGARLMTDMSPAGAGANGGPKRTTMKAQGDYEKYASKHPALDVQSWGFDPARQYTEAEVDQILGGTQLDITQRLARKLELEAAGLLVRTGSAA